MSMTPTDNAIDYGKTTNATNIIIRSASIRSASIRSASITNISDAPTTTLERTSRTARKPYPNYKIIVLNDDENTFQHVSQMLMKYIPGMTSDRAWELTNQVHYEGQAIVWVGPQEQAELHHQQLRRAGLTMAPLEAA